MKRVKILYTVLLAGSIVLVSLHGGAILWLLFYFMLAIPVLALLYVLYIYFRLRIRQQMERYANKGESIPCKLNLANEDLLLMTGIQLNFYEDTVYVMKRSSDGIKTPYEQEPESISLLSHQQKEISLALYCKYRGTYPVGVKSVSVTDLFGLFMITYPIAEQIRLTVRPRILTLAQLQEKLNKRDPKKNNSAAARLQDTRDFELRKYIPGDSLRHVHWKNSARAGELLVRKQEPQELYELVVIMDCNRLKDRTELERMQIEDNIIETAVALLYDACTKKVRSCVIWGEEDLREMQINNTTDFDKFYNLCAQLPFCASMTLEEVWEAYERKTNASQAIRLIGCQVSLTLLQKADKSRRLGKDIVLIDTGEAPL